MSLEIRFCTPSSFVFGVANATFASLLFAHSAAAEPSSPPKFRTEPRLAYTIHAFDSSVHRIDLDTGETASLSAVLSPGANRIVANEDDTLAFVACSGSDVVDVLDLASESRIASIPLPLGSNPWDCEPALGRVYVTALLNDKVYVLDPGASAVVDSIDVGIAPQGMAVAQGHLFVANTGFDFSNFTYGPGSISVIDLATNIVEATVPVPTNPQEVFVAADGRLHVICTGDFFATLGAVRILDPSTLTSVATLPVAAFPGGGFASHLGIVYLGVTTPSFSSEIWSYEAASGIFTHDGTTPLLPTTSFLGNLRGTLDDKLVVPDFTLDALLVEDPASPGSPLAFSVGDGPVDVLVVERESPVALDLSQLRAEVREEGVLLSWHANPSGPFVRLIVERSSGGTAPLQLATDLPVNERGMFLDADPPINRTLSYRVGGVDRRGRTQWLPEAVVRWTGAATSSLLLARAFPNPFRSTTTIALDGPVGERAALTIRDVSGRLVKRHAIGTTSSRRTTFLWDGRDEQGREVAGGIYFVRSEIGGQTTTTRLLRVR